MNVRVGARTDVGRVRQGNEDSYLAEPPLFAVADGMGGHLAGEVASATAVETILEAANDKGANGPDDLKAYVQEANSAVWSKAQDDAELQGMGTTCTLLAVEGSSIHLAHVGDSRAYLMRDGELAQLTEDHTLVERMVREGRLSAEEAQQHPQRSIITRALGVDARVEVDTQTQPVQPGDRLLLCSDGLTSMVESGAIQTALATNPDPQQAADALVDLANEAGGDDNITVVVLDVVDDSEGTEARPAAPIQDRADPPTPSVQPTSTPQPARTPERKHTGRWIAVLAVLAILVVASYAGYRYVVGNLLWFVGVEGDRVTIFRGLPEDVGFLSYREPAETTDLHVDELPEFARSDVEEGHKVDSLEEGREYVANLEARAGEFGSEAATPTPGGTP